MGKWYRVTKRIHGRFYDYWQRTERHGKTTKTYNKYIGPTLGKLPGIYGRMGKDYTIYAAKKDYVVLTGNKPWHLQTAKEAAQKIGECPDRC